MWKKHPLTRFAFGTSLAFLFSLGLILSAVVGADYWADGMSAPQVVQGKVANKSPRYQPRNGVFDLELSNQPVVYGRLEVRQQLFSQLRDGQEVLVSLSPRTHHVYTITILSSGEVLQQDVWKEGVAYQDYQAAIYWTLVGVGALAAVALVYGLFGLVDWLLPQKRERGVLVARIEQADYSAAGYALLLKRWKAQGRHKTTRFKLSEQAFLSTDGVDYLEIAYTPIFRYVRHLRKLGWEDFPPGEVPDLDGSEGQVLRLRYIPNWRRKLFLFSDGLVALVFFGCVVFSLANSIPGWLEAGTSETGPSLTAERYMLPGAAVFLFCLGLLFTVNFLRKLSDLRAPKKVTVGPVLSKWRVNGGTNDTRRQIVVADGGLQAGGAGVRKFDISNHLYEELQVGDIVEIEHTPKLRYIFRLEVKGHQEILGSF